MIIRVYI